jgi:hypothetical protein
MKCDSFNEYKDDDNEQKQIKKSISIQRIMSCIKFRFEMKDIKFENNEEKLIVITLESLFENEHDNTLDCDMSSEEPKRLITSLEVCKSRILLLMIFVSFSLLLL